MKVINKEDVQTKIFLGVHPKYVLKELLMRNLFVYMEGFLLSYIICICINLKCNFITELYITLCCSSI